MRVGADGEVLFNIYQGIILQDSYLPVAFFCLLHARTLFPVGLWSAVGVDSPLRCLQSKRFCGFIDNRSRSVFN